MDYIAAENIVKRLKVVNDTAEGGVSLKQEFNERLHKMKMESKNSFYSKLCHSIANDVQIRGN